MSERPKEHASKACEGATPPWVQIPPPPPNEIAGHLLSVFRDFIATDRSSKSLTFPRVLTLESIPVVKGSSIRVVDGAAHMTDVTETTETEWSLPRGAIVLLGGAGLVVTAAGMRAFADVLAPVVLALMLTVAVYPDRDLAAT